MTSSPSPRTLHRLVGIGKCTKGVTHVLHPDEAVVIGRDPGCTIALTRTPETDGEFEHISRQHAVLEYERGRWILRDNGSLNGTALLNGGIPPAEALSSGESHGLRPDDVIELARCEEFQFAFQDAGGEPVLMDRAVDEKTSRLIRAERRCLQLLVEGTATQVIDVQNGDVLLRGAGDLQGGAGRHGVLNIPGLSSGEAAATVTFVGGSAQLRTGRTTLQLNLEDIAPHKTIALTDGDLLTFPESPGVSVLFLDPLHTSERSLSDLLGNADRITVGTAPDNVCRIIDPSLSRHHAEIWRNEGQLYVRDLQSTNGTTVNDSRVSDSVQLERGARVSLGRLAYVVDDGCWPGQVRKTPSIDVRFVGVAVSIAGKLRLRDVSFGLQQGEMLGLLGPSASGKSTLLKLLAGQLRPAAGEMYVNGRALSGSEERRGWLASLMGFRDEVYEVGFVQQHDLVQPGLTVREILRYAARHMGLDQAQASDRAAEAARLCNLGPLVDRVAQKENGQLALSGGQLKRVCVAIEVLRQPRILVLDEPTTGQDPRNTDDLMHLFRSLSQEGVTLLISTHDLRNLSLFDKVAVLCLGRLVYFGIPSLLPAHFGVETVEQVYASLPDREERVAEADSLEQRFRATPFFREYCEAPA